MTKFDLVQQIVEAISDGVPIDWDRAQSQATPEQHRALAALRVIHDVGVVFSVSDEDPATTVISSATQTANQAAIWNGLEIKSVLGSGGFGTVYRATDPGLQREIALKLVDLSAFPSADVEAYLREGRLQARVRHPNVVQVYGIATSEDHVGIWMELVHGKTLEAILDDDGPYGATETTAIGVELCRALAAVHAAGLVHRDVKTHNIMRERGGRIVLMDLGAGFDPRGEPTKAAAFIGTPLFMAPELIRGGKASEVSDVYSLGVVLYRIATAHYPVVAGSIPDLERAHRERRIRSIRDVRPDLPPHFARVVERALAYDPAARYATAGEFQVALEDSLSSSGTGRPSIDSATQRRISPVWLTAVIALMLALAVVFSWKILDFTAPTGFNVEATMRLSTESGRQALRMGDILAPGDKLSIDYEASSDTFVYVLTRDDTNRMILLFPSAGSDLENPLPGGQRHSLPGSIDGMRHAWVVTAVGGTEHFLILASLEPLQELEADLAALPRPTRVTDQRYASLSEGSYGLLRSVGGIMPDPETGGSDLFTQIEELQSGPNKTSGVWMRRISLASQGRDRSE